LKICNFLNFSISTLSISFAVRIDNTPKRGSIYKINFDDDIEKNTMGITKVARSTVYIDFGLKYDLQYFPNDIRFTDQGRLTSGAETIKYQNGLYLLNTFLENLSTV
jgi:hypothetical protein